MVEKLNSSPNDEETLQEFFKDFEESAEFVVEEEKLNFVDDINAALYKLDKDATYLQERTGYSIDSIQTMLAYEGDFDLEVMSVIAHALGLRQKSVREKICHDSSGIKNSSVLQNDSDFDYGDPIKFLNTNHIQLVDKGGKASGPAKQLAA